MTAPDHVGGAAVSNLSILYRNVLDGLGTEIGRKAFLWAAERRDASRFKYPAEKYAHEVEHLVLSLRPMMGAAARIYRCQSDGALDASDEVMDDLMRFILARHANWCFGGNVKLWWQA